VDGHSQAVDDQWVTPRLVLGAALVADGAENIESPVGSSGCVVERLKQPDVGEVLWPAGSSLHLQQILAVSDGD
jgi:hypothetical protein